MREHRRESFRKLSICKNFRKFSSLTGVAYTEYRWKPHILWLEAARHLHASRGATLEQLVVVLAQKSCRRTAAVRFEAKRFS
jgi:hypothetical protein